MHMHVVSTRVIKITPLLQTSYVIEFHFLLIMICYIVQRTDYDGRKCKGLCNVTMLTENDYRRRCGCVSFADV